MTSTETSALHDLDARLLKPTHKGPTHVAGRTAFRGEIRLTDAEIAGADGGHRLGRRQ